VGTLGAIRLVAIILIVIIVAWAALLWDASPARREWLDGAGSACLFLGAVLVLWLRKRGVKA
jgi:type IV secretory pathway TrbL component